MKAHDQQEPNESLKLYTGSSSDKLLPENSSSDLSVSKDRFFLAMHGANGGLWDWNMETNDVYYSPSWKSMLGYEASELDHKLSTWEVLVHPKDKNRVLEKVQEYLTGQTSSFEVEMRMKHKTGHFVYVLSRAFMVTRESDDQPIRLIGTHVDITTRKRAEDLNDKNAQILEMIAVGRTATEVYESIALMYEDRHPGLRCSMLELHGNTLLHGGAPSLPKSYCEAIHGIKNGPNVGSCGTSTFTGKRVIVDNIATDPKWNKIKHLALPHGMRCCWSEPVKNSSGKVLGAFGMYYNHSAVPNEEESKDLISAARLTSIVMERDHAQKRIRTLAYTDDLTTLPSRAYFCQNLEKIITKSKRHNRKLALLYIDLDNFKSINDSLGHHAGDLLLKEIAIRLKNVCRENDFVARLSGDEFCIIAEEIADYSIANIAQRCLDEISKPLELLTRKITPTCSVGVAYYPRDGNDLTSLIKAADTSLYAAKENGRNQYTFYKPELAQKAEYRFQVEQYLREAIDTQQLTLVYQPQVNVITGEIVGVEALSRWYHPKLGNVSPVDFIATAERIGMIKTFTEWVLTTACQQAMKWKAQGFGNLGIAVNISPSHFLDPAIVPLIEHTLKETGISPANLELEITENVVQIDQRNLSIFKDLKALGIKLAIDDFGTGYSSLASLMHLNVDHLKIDKYFVDDILTDNKALTLMTSMIEMGHKLGYEIIIEGVEKSEQFNALKDLSCKNVQGYWFSKPIKANELSTLLHKSFPV